MNPEIARHCKNSIEAIHSMIYFVPEAEQRFGDLGLKPGRMAYFAGRAAPMGAVSAGVVTATFYNFNRDAVAAEIPRAWSIASPADVVAARFDAADAALRRLLGEQTLASGPVSEAAQIARHATDACDPAGKPLFAGHAGLDWPEQPHLQLWHAISLLREFRGDAHIVALQTAGLTGLQALVLQNAAAVGLAEGFLKASRGWSDEQWAATQEELREAGLIDGDGAITDAGKALREQMEATTDSLSMAPWIHLGEHKIEVLTSNSAELSKAIARAGAFPAGLFAGQR